MHSDILYLRRGLDHIGGWVDSSVPYDYDLMQSATPAVVLGWVVIIEMALHPGLAGLGFGR